MIKTILKQLSKAAVSIAALYFSYLLLETSYIKPLYILLFGFFYMMAIDVTKN